MFLENVECFVDKVSRLLWGYPLIFFIIGSGIVFSFVFRFVQVTSFFSGWKMVLGGASAEEKKGSEKEGEISSLQAFINALSASLGNGGLTGMATVLVDGGPGTAFWVFILGFFSTAIRFAEVYTGLSIHSDKKNSSLVGPLAYIRTLPLGMIWVVIYSVFMFIYVLFGGIALQCNSIGSSLQKITNWDYTFIATLFALFVFYVIVGGSKRIMRVAEIIIPIKVLFFFASIIVVIWYHSAHIIPTLQLILAHAFQAKSMVMGATVFTVQRAIAVGFSRALNATEAGLGTAGIFFGATEAKSPVRTSIMSMITAFISTNLVCAVLIFTIVLTGVSYDGALNGIRLVIASFETVFGNFSAPFITFMSFSFGFGVMVAYSFLGYKLWEFFFGKRGFVVYVLLITAIAFFGTMSSVALVWKFMDLIAGILVFINISALLWNLSKVHRLFVKEKKVE